MGAPKPLSRPGARASQRIGPSLVEKQTIRVGGDGVVSGLSGRQRFLPRHRWGIPGHFLKILTHCGPNMRTGSTPSPFRSPQPTAGTERRKVRHPPWNCGGAFSAPATKRSEELRRVGIKRSPVASEDFVDLRVHWLAGHPRGARRDGLARIDRPGRREGVAQQRQAGRADGFAAWTVAAPRLVVEVRQCNALVVAEALDHAADVRIEMRMRSTPRSAAESWD